MHPFSAAIEAGDSAAVEALLADDVVFTSPLALQPHHGKPMTVAIVRGLMRVCDDFHYVREIADPNGHDFALVSEATVGGRRITGCDFLHLNDDGQISDLMVMVRPLAAAIALGEAMRTEFDRIQAEAAARTLHG